MAPARLLVTLEIPNQPRLAATGNIRPKTHRNHPKPTVSPTPSFRIGRAASLLQLLAQPVHRGQQLLLVLPQHVALAIQVLLVQLRVLLVEAQGACVGKLPAAELADVGHQRHIAI